MAFEVLTELVLVVLPLRLAFPGAIARAPVKLRLRKSLGVQGNVEYIIKRCRIFDMLQLLH